MKTLTSFGLCLIAFTPAASGSQALSNLVDPTAAWTCFADYTNNALHVEAVDSTEWSDGRRKIDRLPFDMPFQLVVGPSESDRQAAETALTAVTTSLSNPLYDYYKRHHLIAPLLQRMIRRHRPGVTSEDQYATATAQPNVWRAQDFDIAQLAESAKNLTSNDVPMMANLSPLYGEVKLSPIKRAEPLVDYPDPRPEETYATPFGIAIVLRAREAKRKFRFYASGWPLNDRNVNFKWVHRGGVWINHLMGQRDHYPLEKGYADIHLDWNGAVRRDVLVFARYGTDPWGPPSVISFYRIPNERRQYDSLGSIQTMEYVPVKDAIPQLYQNKPWRDVFTRDSLGNIVGFLRTRKGEQKDMPFSVLGERILETHAGDIPKATAKVRYFTSTNDVMTLDYEVTKETVTYPQRPVVSRDRGELPATYPRRK